MNQPATQCYKDEIDSKYTVKNVFHLYSIGKEMRWLKPFQATFSLERKSFASGGFRDAYLAKAISGIAKGKYVLKKYKENKVKEIKELFGTTEAYTRKAVQMNALARNFAQNLDLQRSVLEYGPTFKYSKVYYSSFNGNL